MSKTETKLVPGTYRLTEDMPPLRKDKRMTRDWRYCPMPAGKLFFYTEWEYELMDNGVKVLDQRIYPVHNAYSHESVRPDESYETRQLEESLVRVEETPELWIRREHGLSFGSAILNELVTSGKLTMADVQQAAADHDEKSRAAEEATKSK